MTGSQDPARAAGRGGLGSRVLVGAVRGYQLIVSPWIAPRCRYYPSCSQYAIDGLRAHGVVRGAILAAWRVLRCNPWSRGGVDHVPARWRDALHRDDHGPAAPHLVGDHTPTPDEGAVSLRDDPPASRAAARGRTLDDRTSRAQAHG